METPNQSRESSPIETTWNAVEADDNIDLVPGEDFGCLRVPDMREAYERWARREGRRPSRWGMIRYYLPF